MATTPGVILKEVDESSYVETTSVSQAGYVGIMNWGPIDYPSLVSNTNVLAALFGKPTTNAQSWYTAKSYLDYSDNLMLVRSVGEHSKNATDKTYRDLSATLSNVAGEFTVGEKITTSDDKTATITKIGKNSIEFYNESAQLKENTTITGASSGATATITAVDKSYNSMIINTIAEIEAGKTLTGQVSSATAKVIEVKGTEVVYELTSENDFQIDETVVADNGQYTVKSVLGIYHYFTAGILIKNIDDFRSMELKPFIFAARYAGELGNSIAVYYADSTSFDTWQYKNLFDTAPDAGEYHIVVVDTNGVFYNSYAGNVLETYAYVSKDPDAIDINGQNNYYKNKINEASSYIYCGDNDFDKLDYSNQLANGIAIQPNDSDIINSYNIFTQPTTSDTFYLFSDYSVAVDNAIVAICESTQTMQALFSAPKEALMSKTESTNVDAIKAWSNQITISNRVFLDANWRQVLNTFNNTYLWVPCCSATAGLTSRTDTNYDIHMSPMGRTRGIYLNTTKLLWEPSKNAQGAIYSVSVNPIFTQGSFGVVLWGDRTHIMRASRLRQWGVRRMLTTIEIAMTYFLGFAIGENNNVQTRALYKSQLEQFLREKRAQGWFVNFEVILDETNNTEQIINEQKMRVLVRILPQSSINWVELTLVVVNSVAQFTEGGAV